MGLWFLSTLLFIVFGGLYFVYQPERLNANVDTTSQVAGLFDRCRTAAVKQAIITPSLGQAVPTTRLCSYTNLPVADPEKLTVSGVTILFQPYGTGRLVVTYIKPTARIMTVFNVITAGAIGGPSNNAVGIPQTEAARQIRDVFAKETNTGMVVKNDAVSNKIDNGDVTLVKLPLTVDTGSIATQQLVTP